MTDSSAAAFDDPLRYALPEPRFEKIFAERIVPWHLAHGRTVADAQQPRVLLLGGQTGAGKSRTREALTTDPVWRDAVEIGSDILRAHHPAYRSLLRRDPVSAAFYTDHDARRWVDRALSYAADHRLSVIFDSTLSRPATAETITGRFRDAGYHLEAAFIAAPAALSRLSVIDRYQTALLNKLPGRYSLNHDETYQGVQQVTELLDRRVLVHEASAYRRGGVSLYQNHAVVTAGDDPNRPGRWSQAPALARVLHDERQRPWATAEVASFLSDVNRVAEQAEALNQGSVWYGRIADAAELAAPHVTRRNDREQLTSLVDALRARGVSATWSTAPQDEPRQQPAPQEPQRYPQGHDRHEDRGR